MTVERRSFSGTAGPTALTSGIDDNDVTVTVDDATGYPTGSGGPFVVTVDRGTVSEERILVASRTGNVLSVDERGWDGTTAVVHDAAATVEHTISAVDMDEANQAAVAILGGWQTFDPGVTTSGSVIARYRQTGKTVHFNVRINAGATDVGVATITLPVVAANTAGGGVVFNAMPFAILSGVWYMESTSEASGLVGNASTDALPIAYADGGFVIYAGTYEAA